MLSALQILEIIVKLLRLYTHSGDDPIFSSGLPAFACEVDERHSGPDQFKQTPGPLVLVFPLRIGCWCPIQFLRVALVVSVVTDILINIALIFHLHKARGSVIATRQYACLLFYLSEHSAFLFSRIVQRITRLAIITGCATSLIVVAMMIAVLVRPIAAIANGIGSCIGRAYSPTMMYILLNRDEMSKDPWLHVIVDTQSMPPLTPQVTVLVSLY
ncbi:hypothetical protein GALMADRAFT_843311 [Galerina marginata CBS 339.88]|uniref:DUF6534 domain-containing protein n=1 Tax=Galerina marginata (strain CBS 339.88) TaxID=685588 RepID=A0A067THK3_GALM3|nr:hypothetical protein GALMADRAFT_843311 [Galerina marginata CBS 339.88]